MKKKGGGGLISIVTCSKQKLSLDKILSTKKKYKISV